MHEADPQEEPEGRGDFDAPYEELFLPEYAETAAATFEAEANGRGDVVLTGRCPRCGHAMEFLIVKQVVRDVVSPAPAPEVVFCTCRHDHPGRPDEEVGCGATWALEVTP